MLTLQTQIVVEQFAKQIIEETKRVFKTKNIPRKSVRFEQGKKIETTFSAPVSATGSLANSLRYELTDTHLIVYANDYAYYLIYGRKPTTKSGSGEVKRDILKWIRAKGIQSDINENQLAYLISRKIHRFGNSIYLFSGNNNSGLLNNILTDALKREYNDKFVSQLGEDLQAEFNGN